MIKKLLSLAPLSAKVKIAVFNLVKTGKAASRKKRPIFSRKKNDFDPPLATVEGNKTGLREFLTTFLQKYSIWVAHHSSNEMRLWGTTYNI